eukprot:gene30460-35470_t
MCGGERNVRVCSRHADAYPLVLVPLLNAEIDQEGPLSALIIERGSLDVVKQSLLDQGFTDLRVEFPAPPGEALAIAL